MAATRSRRPEPCAYEDCGSRRFLIGGDGYTYCEQGHQQSERGTVTAAEDANYVPLGRKSRRIDSDVESTTSKGSSFRGTRAVEHHLLCIQLILRKQLRWLIEVQKLPEELETLVRDLWALRLQKLSNSVAYDSETDTEGQSSQRYSSQSENEQSDSQTTTASRSTRRSRKRSPRPKESSSKLVETLVFCYVGILLLRIPVTIADFHGWINDGELLYYRAAREVPLGMRERLPGQYQDTLEPQGLLAAHTLHQHVLETLKALHENHGMEPPRLNSPLVLFRWMRDLALPIEVFAATQRLARLLDFDVKFDLGDNVFTKVVLRYPEAQLMALVVVATKLLFPLDGRKRYPATATDLSVLSMDWDVWVEAQRDEDTNKEKSTLSFAESFNFNEADCIDAANNKLDDYLAWCEDNLATEDTRQHGRAAKEADFRQALFDMFPVRSKKAVTTNVAVTRTQHDANNKLRHVQSTLVPRRVIEPNRAAREPDRAGSFYRRFRAVEELSGPAKVFYEKAAHLAGLSLDGMIQAVFAIERKLEKHEKILRKAARDRLMIE